MTVCDIIVLCCLCAGLLGIVIGVLVHERSWRQLLVDRGLAEWRISNKGKRSWHWKGEE